MRKSNPSNFLPFDPEFSSPGRSAAPKLACFTMTTICAASKLAEVGHNTCRVSRGEWGVGMDISTLILLGGVRSNRLQIDSPFPPRSSREICQTYDSPVSLRFASYYSFRRGAVSHSVPQRIIAPSHRSFIFLPPIPVPLSRGSCPSISYFNSPMQDGIR